MSWLKLTIEIPEEYQESLIAELAELNFEGFEQFNDRLDAYVAKPGFGDKVRKYIDKFLKVYPVDCNFHVEEISEQNWNEVWEATIQPLSIGDFFIKPTWSDEQPDSDKILIQIDPKMSFGTGYHETTQLMLEAMPEMDPKGKKVLDAGTGTGILAIAALKLGAKQVFAFDIDTWCRDNSLENAVVNDVEHAFHFVLGGAETIPEDLKFELILANINRNVILGMITKLTRHLAPGGSIAFTGLFEEDLKKIKAKAQDIDLEPVKQRSKAEWHWIQFKKAVKG